MSTLLLTVLGAFAGTWDKRPLPAFRSNKTQALLIYLTTEAAFHGPQPHQREALMTLLWPDVLHRSAQTNLRQTLYQLRQVVPAIEQTDGEIPFVLADRQTVQLNPHFPWVSDLEQFVAMVSKKGGAMVEWETAVSHYQNDLCAGFYLFDSNPFEEWLAARREEVRRQALETLYQLADWHLAEGRFAEAEAHARRQLAIDHLRESAHRQMIETLARSGKRSAALAQYDLYVQMMQTELAAEPSSEIRLLVEAVQVGDFGVGGSLMGRLRGYQLREEIGAGSFGVVYRGVQTAVNREVAIKSIHPHYSNNPAFIRRFESEAQTIARLEHPYIVPLYDFWREPKGAFLVMRWLRGGALQQRLEQVGGWPLEPALKLVEQIGVALGVAHAHGVVHRDLKAANILLDEADNAYLSDFGIARNVLDIDSGLEKIGASTLTSISPEQVRNEAATPQSDIYSFGVLLYQLLTGQPPFMTTSLATLIQKHLNDPLPNVGELRPELPTAVNQVIQQATAKQPTNRYGTVADFVQALQTAVRRPTTDHHPIVLPFDATLRNPYKGLHAFQEADAADFFGRQSLVGALCQRLSSSSSGLPGREPLAGLASNRFLAVVGPSGSGKSSVVKAGVMPALRAGAVPGSPDWFMVDMLPGTHPLEELETALLRVAVNPPSSLLEQMQQGERGILQAVRRILPEGGELLLLIDQFEELFTLTDERRRGEFLAGLLTAVADPRTPLHLIITLRADFYDRPLQHEQLGRLLQQQTELVLPLSAAEIEQAIVQPAQAVGCHFEPGLVSTIVADIQDQPGSLPLLQYALTELFERRNGNRLTKATYDDIGGVLGALGRRAEEIFTALDEPDRQLARQLFLRLVTLGEGVEDTRRRVLQSELLALAGEQGSGGAGEQGGDLQSPISNLLDLYGRFRLLTFDHDPASREPTVEVAHEALLREWPRLRDWLAESRHDVGMQRLLAHGAQEWEQAQQDASYLLRGSRLVQFEDWVSDSSVVLTPGERTFLQASIAAREARQAEEEARRQRELQTAQQLAETERQRAEEQVAAAGRLRQRAVYLGVAALLAVLLAVAAFGFSRQSNQNANLAAAREQEAVAEADQRATAEANAVAAAVEAQAAQATAQAEAITRAQAEQEASSQRDLAQASAQEAVQAYSLSLAANARQALEANDQQLALLLALAANKVPDPPLQSWQTLLDIAYAPGLKKELPTATTGVVAVSPDGQTIAVGSPDGVVSLFDTVSGEQRQQLEGFAGVNAIAFDADGQRLLLGLNNGEVVLWGLTAGALVRRFVGHIEAVSYVGFHPNGRYIISTEDGRAPADIVVWDMATGEIVRRFGSEEGGNWEGIRNMAITPDGTKALAGVGSQNRTNPYPLVLWNLETGEPIHFFEGLARSVNGVDVSPNGRLGLSGSADGSVRLWDLETGEMLKRLDGHEGIVIRVAFSPDGRTALSTSLDHTIIWWDLDSGEIIHRFAGYYANDAGGIKFLNNRQAVAAAPSGSTYILDLDSNWLLEHWPGKHQAPINGLAISHDGTIAVSAAGAGEAHLPQDNTLIVWDYQTGESLQQLVGHEDPVLTVAFLPDDTQLLSGDRGGKLILWDLQTGKPVREYVENNSSAVALAVSSDGKYAAVATQAGQVVYWHLQSGLALRRFTGAMTPIRMTDVAFTVDDQHVLAASADNTVLIWDVKSGEQLMRLTGFHGGVGSPFTTQYSMEDQLISRMAVGSDGRTILTVGAYDRVLLWDLQTGQAIRSFVGHRDFATDAAMSSDGRRALTSDGGKALILWDVATGDPIRQHRISNTYTPFGIVNENTNQVAIHPSGQTALTSEPDGSILKWQLADPSPMELMDWLAANRELRELTCLERRTFQIEPLCVDGVAGETTAGLLTAVRHSLQTLVIPTQETAEAPQPAFQLPAQPPRPTRVAQLGENRGELVANDFDVWTYDGKAGELLTLRMVADNPANDPTIPFDGRRAAGVLDPFLFVIAPDSTKLAMGDDDLTTDGTRLSDAFLNAVLLPEDGQYRIEARSFLDDGEGGYTLLIESGAVTVDVDILRDYEGVYLEGPWEFDIVVHVEDGTLYLDTLQTGTSDKLIPLSDNEFVMAGDGSIFVFVRNEAGVVTRYEIWPAAIHPVSGHWYPAEKVGELP